MRLSFVMVENPIFQDHNRKLMMPNGQIICSIERIPKVFFLNGGVTVTVAAQDRSHLFKGKVAALAVGLEHDHGYFHRRFSCQAAG